MPLVRNSLVSIYYVKSLVKSHKPTDAQTHRPTDPQTQGPTDPQTQRPTDPQSHRPTDPQTHSQTNSFNKAFLNIWSLCWFPLLLKLILISFVVWGYLDFFCRLRLSWFPLSSEVILISFVAWCYLHFLCRLGLSWFPLWAEVYLDFLCKVLHKRISFVRSFTKDFPL